MLKSPPPEIYQGEYHPFYHAPEFRASLASAAIQLVAYGSLARPLKMARRQPKISAIAQRHGRSVVHVLLRWAIQQGASLIVRSTSRDHLQSNLDVLNFVLSDEDMAVLNSMPQIPKGYGHGALELE